MEARDNAHKVENMTTNSYIKKRDPAQCINYREIMLLNTIFKILTSMIRDALGKCMKGQLGECQQGFRKERSTVNVVHILTQIFEKCYEHNQNK